MLLKTYLDPKTNGVDFLRGVAISMVVLFHAVGCFHGFWVPWEGNFRHWSSEAVTRNFWFYPITCCWSGVALFFVISGFCIHLSFLRSEQRFHWRDFYWRRFWRIYPAYFGVNFLLMLLSRQANSGNREIQILTHLLFVHNFSESTFFGINPSMWSLATEMQLYGLFPALIALRARIGMMRSMLVLFSIACLWRMMALILWPLQESPINCYWSNPMMTWFDWSLGALVAERFARGRRTFTRPYLCIFGFGSLFFISTLFKPFTIFSFTLASTTFAVVLDIVVTRSFPKTRLTQLLCFVGLISYSIYLWHQPFIIPISEKLSAIGFSPGITWLGYAIFVLAASMATNFSLERIGTSFTRRLNPRMP